MEKKEKQKLMLSVLVTNLLVSASGNCNIDRGTKDFSDTEGVGQSHTIQSKSARKTETVLLMDGRLNDNHTIYVNEELKKLLEKIYTSEEEFTKYRQNPKKYFESNGFDFNYTEYLDNPKIWLSGTGGTGTNCKPDTWNPRMPFLNLQKGEGALFSVSAENIQLLDSLVRGQDN